MAAISLPGLFTGIDTNLLVSQLMAVNQRRLNTLEASKSTWEEKDTALSDLEIKLATFRTTVQALDDANELRAFNVTSSDTDKITAEATYSAFEGNHTVVINQLANSEQWVHTSGLEYAEDYVKTSSAGTFIYSYNHKETIITTTTTTTLQDLVGLINNDANNPGVTASLLYYAGAYHLVLNGNDAGSDYAISINASNTEVRQADSAFTADGNATLSTKITDLDQFTPGAWGGDEKITFTGKDHNGNSISGEVSVNINTKLFHLIEEINDAFDGRAKAVLENGKIVLTDDTFGTSQMVLTLTYDSGTGGTDLTVPAMAQLTQGGSTTADLTNFAASDFTESQAAQDSKIKVDGFPSTSAVSEVQTLTPTTNPGSGDYTLTYDGQTTAAIDFNAPATGAGSVQEALEALQNVSSGDITVADSGSNGLADGNLTFTFLNTLGNVSLISINPANLDQSDNSNYTMVETPGSDGNISRSSNTIDDVLPGVTLHLHDTTDAGGEEVNLTRDIELVKEKLNKMVNAYNAVVVYLKEKAGYNEILERGGVLMGDYIVSTMRSQILDPFIERVSGFLEDVDTFLMAADIGLELDRDGMLNLDDNVFDEAIAENYMDALAVIGAAKTGSSDSNYIKFYGASSSYTTAGTYDVEVDFDGGGNITAARIKLSTESSFRSMPFDGSTLTGDMSFDDDGDPLYPEHSLQLTAEWDGASSTQTATVYVKQGFAGALEDALKDILRTTSGSIQIDQEYVDDVIEDLKDKIEAEEERLIDVEARLVEKFARLERYLALMQQQLSVLSMLSLY